MKKLFLAAICSLLIGTLTMTATGTFAYAAFAAPEVSAFSAYAVEQNTGTEIFAKNADARKPIASMTKIMTLLLIFEKAEQQVFSFDDCVTVSQTAAGMGGSQAFLDAGSEYTVKDLVHTIIIASANDACVAMAELISGSVEGFVAEMNDRAAKLGMADTHFVNCTGLPALNHYSTAKDVAMMSRALFAQDAYYDFSQDRIVDFTHPSGRITQLTNTNRLIGHLDGCDGGKTGFTNEAGFCLSVTAKRDNMRLVSVVMGETDSKTRFNDAAKLINFGYANYAMTDVVSAGTARGELKVTGGKEKTLTAVAKDDVRLFSARGANGEVTLKEELTEGLSAPIAKGDCVGKLYVLKDGVVVGETDLVSDRDVSKRTFKDAWDDVIGNF